MRDPLLPPPFSLFENGGEIAGVNFPLKASSPKKKRFIFEFQVLLLTFERFFLAEACFLCSQAPVITAEIASSQKTLFAMTAP